MKSVGRDPVGLAIEKLDEDIASAVEVITHLQK